ncbi:L,D-transpeptidase family protein [Streptomyces sp. NBC_00055]|uniref:L,D-transpeptidase family protein n=1 Tax=Streptomyces sp. NBC_00055 TaxID=2975632 RepID=UPI00386B4FD2
MPRPGARASRRPPYTVCAALLLLLTGCAAPVAAPGPTAMRTGAHAPTAHAPTGNAPAAHAPTGNAGAAGPGAAAARRPAAPTGPFEIRMLGQVVRSAIPAESRQALVVTGNSPDSSEATAVLYTRDDPTLGWQPEAGPWPAHNALYGWTDEHYVNDLRTPIGVYGLTAAGGRLEAPGTELPYVQSPAFTASGEGFDGESLEGSFDYVIAIDYNRVPGASPLDPTRPFGEERGGGIWLHVDHGGPTQGCVSLPEDRMEELLRILDPAKVPVIVMGDVAALAR